MNRKKIFSLLLIMFFVVVMAELIVADGSFIEFMASVNFGFREADIVHTGVKNVSPQEKLMNIDVSVLFGDYVRAEKAELLYYFGTNISSTHTVTSDEKILHKRSFFMKTNEWVDDASMSYQIKVTLRKQDGSLGYAYWPTSDTFHTATIADSTSTVINVSGGGSVEFESGNQKYKYTKVVIPGHALSGDTTITIKQLPVSAVSLLANGSNSQMVSLYSIVANPDVEIESSPLTVDFYYGSKTEIKKFDLKYREDESSPWETVKILNVDIENRIISADINKFGQYGVFVASDLEDSDYRPQKRVKIKSRIANGTYSGFEFNYLQEGDVVKIYNVNGKKIREIKEGTGDGFSWDGKKDNGDWAESGIYIYQIKLKEKSKIISGTIAFVW